VIVYTFDDIPVWQAARQILLDLFRRFILRSSESWKVSSEMMIPQMATTTMDTA